MSTHPLLAALLPVVVGVLMLGLGLALTPADFARAARSPRAVAVALCCQLLLLPAVCLALVTMLDLAPVLATGMMLLAATPGGTTAGLFSHLAKGDVALNLALTALNSVLAPVTLPVVVGFSAGHFLGDGAREVRVGFGELVGLWLLIVIPVVAGMAVRGRWAKAADRVDRPVKVLATGFLVVLAVATVLTERDDVLDDLADAGPAAVLFCVISLATGYAVPRLAGVSGAQAVATAMDIGVHNSGLAVAIALSLGTADDSRLAVPGVAYAIVTIPCAALAVLLLRREDGGTDHGDVRYAVLKEGRALGREAPAQVKPRSGDL
ncbi:bile acid:sodium symporter family protein [Actinomadura roseirufa]|uniref:bile acid:sodium symporter family protein n=1 Tax=Actinomadura roseirufa TaxID=2094049 RepID=UPI001041098D|nr:bile acid:sodium symporter family protein [Actinomadura roseirufa]